MQTELQLFEPINIESANRLLALLNDDRKNDLFRPIDALEFGDNLILSAHNKEFGYVFNIVDRNGKTPDGFSACWRSAQHIRHELELP